MDVVALVVLGTVLVSWQLMERPDKSKWMLVPSRCYTHKEWYRVITHAFVHADWLHLAFNMFVLYEFGRVVNRELAGLGWMGFPALPRRHCGRCHPCVQKHKHNPSYASLGASGAVSAVLLAFIVLHPTHTLLLFFVIPMPAVLAGVLFFWYESRMQQRGRTRIAHDAHLGGALVGVAWVVLFVPSAVPRFIQALQGLLP